MTENTYKIWSDTLLTKINEIARKKYPDVPYWIDTGSSLDCAMEMLCVFERDLKTHKDYKKRFDKFCENFIKSIKEMLQ